MAQATPRVRTLRDPRVDVPSGESLYCLMIHAVFVTDLWHAVVRNAQPFRQSLERQP